jgi:hypothetical protein
MSEKVAFRKEGVELTSSLGRRPSRMPFVRHKMRLSTPSVIAAHGGDPLGAYRKRYLLSICETADLLGFTPRQIRHRIEQKDPSLPTVRVGRRVLIDRVGVFAAFGIE